MDLMDQADSTVKAFVNECSISCQEDWSHWPKELEEVRRICEEARKAYNAKLCKQRRRFYGVAGTSNRLDDTAVIEANILADEEEETQGASGGEEYGEYDEENDEFLEGIDNFPATESIGFNLIAFEQVSE
jgi:hypothetical protein